MKTIRYRFHHIHEASADQVEAHTRKKAKLLEARLSMSPADLVCLNVRLSARRKRYVYRAESGRCVARLVLWFPGPNIAARGYRYRWMTAINNAIEDIDDQRDTYLKDLRREPQIRDYQKLLALEPAGTGLVPEPVGEAH